MTSIQHNLRLYLDSSVFAFVAERRTHKQVRKLFDKHDWIGVVSHTALAEAVRAPFNEWPARRLALTTLPSEFLHPPESYLEAMEFINEARRLRPHWIQPAPSLTRSKQLLRKQKEHWRSINSDTPFDQESFLRRYLSISEPGISDVRGTQKELRSILSQHGEQNVDFDALIEGSEERLFPNDMGRLPRLERFGRISALHTWQNALLGSPQLVDLNDWASPYLSRQFRPDGEDFASFWLREAQWNSLPHHRTAYLISYFQLRRKITHGNAADTNHALGGLRANIILTCDSNFASILNEAKKETGSHFPRCCLLKRAAENAAEEILRAMAETLSTP